MASPRITSLALLLAAAPLFAHAVNTPERVTIPNSAHRRLASLVPVRAVAPDFAMERMLLVLQMPQEVSASLKQLLKDQQDPSSARFHQWLNPDDFGKQFGPTQAQRDAATLWLLQQGFKVESAARSGLAITFSGSAAQVGKAFQTTIMEYSVNGVTHHGNGSNISIPGELAGFVHGVASLNDLRRAPRPSLIRSLPLAAAGRPGAVDSSGNTFISPGDFQTIYNLGPLYAAGLTGQGVTIGIVGQTDIANGDFAAFRSLFNLGYGGSLTVTQTGADPGTVDPGDEGESELDTQWSSAAAPGASIDLVVSHSSAATGGVDLSAQYLVDNNVAPIISMSYGECEADMGGAGSVYMAFYNNLWAQAASEGITVFVSAGDSGVAGCDDPVNFTATMGKAVSGMASTPYNTCVGGSQFTGTGSSYWSGGKTATSLTTALGYVPEAAWDESTLDNGFRLYAGGGGASLAYAKPAWQSALGVPKDGMRDVPDVALNAAAITDPTAVMIEGSLQEYGGTSVASPCMAGIMALVVQKYGRQGNINPTLYQLGSAQYAGTGPAVFHDITSGNNSVPGQVGFNAGVGYDQVTGLGSIDATLLLNNWGAVNPISVNVLAPAAPVTIASGQTVTFNGSGSDTIGGSPLTYLWSFGDGSTATTPSTSHQYAIAGPQSQTFSATLSVSDGTHVQASAPVSIKVTPAGVSPIITMPVTSFYAFPTVPIAFTATATTQNNGTITNYSWNFGDGGTAVGAAVSHTFAEYDTDYRTVTLTATDSTGATGQTTFKALAATGNLLDCNGDGNIDVRDLLTLAAAWNPQEQANYLDFNGLNVWADLNADGVVDDSDLNLWIITFPAAL